MRKVMEVGIQLPDGWKRWIKRYQYILLAIAAGILILLLPTGNKKGGEEVSIQQGQQLDELGVQEERLGQILSQIHNAGKVRIMLSVRESRKTVLAYDRKTDGEHSQYDAVIVARGSGNQQPVILQETGPIYQGALVVCDGGDEPQVKLEILNAVRSLTGLSADRICICKSK